MTNLRYSKQYKTNYNLTILQRISFSNAYLLLYTLHRGKIRLCIECVKIARDRSLALDTSPSRKDLWQNLQLYRLNLNAWFFFFQFSVHASMQRYDTKFSISTITIIENTMLPWSTTHREFTHFVLPDRCNLVYNLIIRDLAQVIKKLKRKWQRKSQRAIVGAQRSNNPSFFFQY